MASCCLSSLEKVELGNQAADVAWFNNQSHFVTDREQMLQGSRPKSCSHCWKLEDTGYVSERTTERVHTTTVANKYPELLSINVHNLCNLTCAYCSPKCSSAWFTDVRDRGDYQGAHILAKKDFVKYKISNENLKGSKNFKLLLDVLNNDQMSHVKEVALSGGEPLLTDLYQDVLTTAYQKNPNIKFFISTGLGISDSKLQSFIDFTSHMKSQITITLSQESTGKTAECLRYGIKWNEWVAKVNRLADAGFTLGFHSVITVPSLYAMADFVTWKHHSRPEIAQAKHDLSVATSPEFFSIINLDSDIVNTVSSSWGLELASKFKTDQVQTKTDQAQLAKLKEFLTEFMRRRSIPADALPQQFWNLLNEK